MQPQVQYSPDGLWFWDGARWRPAPRPTQPPPPPVTEGMFWFMAAPDWFGPYVLMALINFIPLVGTWVLLGWMLEARDNLRRGWGLVPPAGFQYLERGIRVWVPLLVYGLVVWLVVAVGVAVVVLLALARVPWYGVLAAGLAALAIVVAIGLLVGFLFAAQVSLADRYGIGAGIDPMRVWRTAAADARNAWRAFGAILLASVLLWLVTVTLTVILFLFGGWLAAILVPASFLMPCPALADFDETGSFRADPGLAPALRR